MATQNNTRSFVVIALGAVVLLASVALYARHTNSQPKSVAEIQVSKGIVPCDTDTDCLEKNGDLADNYAKGIKQVYTCDSFTKKGERCKRHVKENGLMCWQHSREYNDPKTHKAFLARQPKGVN